MFFYTTKVAVKYGRKGVIELMGGRGRAHYSDINLANFSSPGDLNKIVACQRLVRKWRKYRRSFYYAGMYIRFPILFLFMFLLLHSHLFAMLVNAAKCWKSRYESMSLKIRFRKVREVCQAQDRYANNLRKMIHVMHLHIDVHQCRND